MFMTIVKGVLIVWGSVVGACALAFPVYAVYLRRVRPWWRRLRARRMAMAGPQVAVEASGSLPQDS
jgi:hypothetical protein